MNYTETLASGEYCEVNVDTTAFVGRVVFDDALTLGVEIDDYRIGDVHTVKEGKQEKIIVYNGDTSGAITFTLAFKEDSRVMALGFLALLSLLGFIYL